MVSLAALWYSRGQKLAADRSARAAEASAAEAKRSADAASDLTAIERERRGEEVATAIAERVRFNLRHYGGNRYVLRNDGTGPAYKVRVDTGNMGALGERRQFPVFAGGAEFAYSLSPDFDTAEPVVRVC